MSLLEVWLHLLVPGVKAATTGISRVCSVDPGVLSCLAWWQGLCLHLVLLTPQQNAWQGLKGIPTHVAAACLPRR